MLDRRRCFWERFCAIPKIASESWLNRNQSPDKRHALRNYFHTNFKRSNPRYRKSAELLCDALFLVRRYQNTQHTTHTQNPTQKINLLCGRTCELLRCCLKIAKFAFFRKSLFSTKRPTIEIWLILPVVICLFQGLSHACLRITALQESAHGSLHQTQSAAKMLRFPQKWITWRNAKLIHESIGVSSTHAAAFG